ncbi:hypothetical protein SAMN05444166_0368 [Singulisphaera sp. GP187]|nr:hypothetical protein SAMN05444166_0368 [Singulisphaera sp. GP187]
MFAASWPFGTRDTRAVDRLGRVMDAAGVVSGLGEAVSVIGAVEQKDQVV